MSASTDEISARAAWVSTWRIDDHQAGRRCDSRKVERVALHRDGPLPAGEMYTARAFVISMSIRSPLLSVRNQLTHCWLTPAGRSGGRDGSLLNSRLHCSARIAHARAASVGQDMRSAEREYMMSPMAAKPLHRATVQRGGACLGLDATQARGVPLESRKQPSGIARSFARPEIYRSAICADGGVSLPALRRLSLRVTATCRRIDIEATLDRSLRSPAICRSTLSILC